MSLYSWRHKIIGAVKRILYGSRGEPIAYGSHHLRYVPGSRPVRLKYANSSDIVARNDARQLAFFMERIKPGDFVLDVGAHYGEYAVLFAALVGPKGRVVSFEPDAAARPILLANLALNHFTDRVRVEELAMFDESAEQPFFARHGNSQSSLARTGLGGAASDDDVEHYAVSSVRMDEYLQRSNLPLPHVIKLDVEGAEYRVLRGAGDVLRSKALILCELHPYAWQELGTSYEDILRLVRDAGRYIKYLDESLRIEDGPTYGAVIIS